MHAIALAYANAETALLRQAPPVTDNFFPSEKGIGIFGPISRGLAAVKAGLPSHADIHIH